jgi:hypothetical protein
VEVLTADRTDGKTYPQRDHDAHAGPYGAGGQENPRGDAKYIAKRCHRQVCQQNRRKPSAQAADSLESSFYMFLIMNVRH